MICIAEVQNLFYALKYVCFSMLNVALTDFFVRSHSDACFNVWFQSGWGFCVAAKHGRHIGIMTPSGSSSVSVSSGVHTFGCQSITLEGMHQLHSNFTEGSPIKYRSGRPKNFDCVVALFDLDFG